MHEMAKSEGSSTGLAKFLRFKGARPGPKKAAAKKPAGPKV